jgi:hypothetical protein
VIGTDARTAMLSKGHDARCRCRRRLHPLPKPPTVQNLHKWSITGSYLEKQAHHSGCTWRSCMSGQQLHHVHRYGEDGHAYRLVCNTCTQPRAPRRPCIAVHNVHLTIRPYLIERC